MSYDKEYYESNNYQDYNEREARYWKMAEEIVGLLRSLNLIRKTSEILDYGCGFGFLIAGLERLGYENVFGYDISEYATEVAQSRGHMMVPIPTEDDPDFDVSFALDVFEHMTDEQLEEYNDKIKSNTLIGRIPCSLVKGKGFHLEVSRVDPTHINCKTKEQWKELLKEWGYSVVLDLDLFSIYDSPGVFSFIALKGNSNED